MRELWGRGSLTPSTGVLVAALNLPERRIE